MEITHILQVYCEDKKYCLEPYLAQDGYVISEWMNERTNE